MSDLNRATILGRLGSDPEKRVVGDTSVTTLSIATGEKWKDKSSGEMKERTEWHRVTMWGRLGEVADQYLKKGSQVYIEGSIQTQKYQDKETGQDRYSTQIVGNRMQLLGSRSDAGGRDSPPPAEPSGGFNDSVPF